MEDVKFYISDYDLQGYEKLGIFCNGHRIFFNPEDKMGICNYVFRFRVSINDGSESIIRPEYSEIIEFHYKCNLNNFKSVWTMPKWMQMEDEPLKKIQFNCEKLLKTACPDLFEYVKDRLIRYKNNDVPDRVEYIGKWCKGYEFLEFTEETACSWAGPFEQDDTKGACLEIKYNKFDIPNFNPKSDFSYYNCPRLLQGKLDEIGKSKRFSNGDYYLHPMSSEEKEELFNTFTISDQHETFKNALRYYSSIDTVESILPYKIYICGNDDSSYSKWFATKEETEKELEYLRKMQPLDFSRDILNRKYLFTN